MKKAWRKILQIVILLSTSQALALLFNFSLGGALLVGLAASAYYLLETGEFSLKELASGAAGFTVSSFALAATGKVLFLDNLCKTARAAAETNSQLTNALSTEQVCRGFLENWITLLLSNPLQSWYFWILAVAAGVLSAYTYRKYGE